MVTNRKVHRVSLELRGNLRLFFSETKASEIVLYGPAGTGKALSLDTEIPTIDGWRTVDSVAVGDYVFKEDGKPVPVTHKSAVMLDHQLYMVWFSDNSCVKADADHLWEVIDVSSCIKRYTKTRSGNKHFHRLLTTQHLYSERDWGRSKYAVECCDAVEYPKRRLAIDPYVLGCWLGDGDSRDACYTCADPEIISRIRSLDYKVVGYTAVNRYRIDGLLDGLRFYGLLHNKHVPIDFLQSSVEDRYELLRGLMDTDGHCGLSQGTCEFVTIKQQLAEDAYELVCSLGIKAVLSYGVAKLYGHICSGRYRLTFTTDKSVFNLSRKLLRLPNEVRDTQSRRYIVRVEPIPSEPVQCIKVASDRGLFLVTRSFIPTHNTRVILERQHLINSKYPGARGLIVRRWRSAMNETVLELLDNEVFRDGNPESPTYGLQYPDSPKWHERDQKYVYDNGSEIYISGMDESSKVLSSKFDWIVYSECGESKRAEWETLMSRLRNFKVPRYQQIIGDLNPVNPSHWTNVFGNEGKILFLATTHKDNPAYWSNKGRQWTDKGLYYIEKILKGGLTGLAYKRLYLGLWVAAEGQVYTYWNPEIHVIPRQELPKHWMRYWSFDFGFVDPFVWHEWVQNPNNGQMILYRELYHTNLRVEQAAKLIKSVSFGVTPYALICDHDAENRATLEKEFGYLTLPAFKSIHPGIQAVQNRLKEHSMFATGKEVAPGLVVMENANILTDKELINRHKPTCTQSEFEGYLWDTGKISLDKYKDLPIDKDNHGMDAARYMASFLDDIAIDPQQFSRVVNYNDELEEEVDALSEHYQDTLISPV